MMRIFFAGLLSLFAASLYSDSPNLRSLTSQDLQGPSGPPGPAGPQGLPGEPGKKGKEIAHEAAYFYKLTPTAILSQEPFLFDGVNHSSSAQIQYNNVTGEITIAKGGLYKLDYMATPVVSPLSDNPVMEFGIQLNGSTILPGSVYSINPQSSKSKPEGFYTELHGTLLVPLEKNDQVRVMNLSSYPLNFEKTENGSVSASLSIIQITL